MNLTRKHWQRSACFFLALFLILLLPASGIAQEATEEAPVAAEVTETPAPEVVVTEAPEETAAPVETEAAPEETAAPVETEAPEETPEATSEATDQPEATPEVTAQPEATPEVTAQPEATPETEETATLSAVGYSKFPAGLADVLDLISAGDFEGAADSLLNSGYTLDRQNRVALQMHPAAGISTQALEQRINRWNSRVVNVNPAAVIAFIPLNRLPNLLENEMFGQVNRPPTARSTGPIGEIASEAFNLAGLADWHDAGFTGAGVRIGIVDTGYTFEPTGSAITDSDYACLAEPPVDDIQGGFHGIYMIQTICDMAPNASVFPYSVNVDGYRKLSAAVYEAIADQIDILVIAIDISEFAPGDGTGLEDGSDDPYEALALARAGGMVIFASAGNYGQVFDGSDTDPNADGADTRGDRYMTFEVSEETPSVEVARIYARVTPGDEIFISWNDWAPNGLGLSDAANLEDFTFEVWEYDTSDQSLDRNLTPPDPAPSGVSTEHEERTDLFGSSPSYTFRIQPTAAGCPAINVGGFYDNTCNIAIRIFRLKGDSTEVIFHMGLTGIARFASGAKELQTADVEFVDFDAMAGTTLLTGGGSISRPADSPDVIAVGAVCANENSNYALDPNSSRGAIYGANGEIPTLPSGALTQSTVKPDIVSFSYVSPRLHTTTDPAWPVDADETGCDGTMDGIDSMDTFGGTSAAAAHAAGMTAVMLSNPNFRNLFPRSGDGVQGIQNYIQRRSVELPLGAGANGYDYDYGSGLFILGSPDYNPVNVSNPSVSADLIMAGTSTTLCDKDNDILNTPDGLLLYVGQVNLESTQDGTLANPYLSIAQAIDEANADGTYLHDCIVVMPGEYVTPILIDTGSVSLYSFDSVTSLAFTQTVIRVSGQYSEGTDLDSNNIVIHKNGAIYLDGVSDVLIQGFIFSSSRTLLDTTTTPTTFVLPVALPRQAIFADGTSGVQIIGNSFGQVTADGSTYDGFNVTPIILFEGDSGHVDSNSFINNTGGTYASDVYISPVISVFDHGTDNATAAVLYNNTIRGNVASELATGETYWSSLIYASDSWFDIAANTIMGNTASTLIYIKADGNEDIRIVSNNFQNNTLSTTGAANSDPAGSLVQISSSANELSFVNNTVVKNILTQSTAANSAVIGRGTRAGLSTVGRFDFTSNMIYENTMPTQRIIASSDSNNVTGTDCINLPGVETTVPIRNNWWHNYPGAECGNAMGANLNRDDDPNSQFIGTYLTLDQMGGNNPNYYILGVIDTDENPDIYGEAVDVTRLDNVVDGDSVDSSRDGNGDLIDNEFATADVDGVSDELGNNINMLAYPFNLAANSEARIFDIETWHSNGQTTPPTPTNPEFDLDIGAFEFVNLNILPNILSDIFVEDSPLHAINLDLDIEGGFGSLEFRILNPPFNFGTHCGPEFEDDGVAFGTGAQAQVFYYCPPRDFYTTGAAGYPDSVDIEIEVEDDIGLTDTSIISLSIDPDTDPLPLDAGVDEASMTAEDFVVITNVEQQGVRVRLRPFVNFGDGLTRNFAFSERANNDFYINGAYAVDYPFTYSNFVINDDAFDDIIEDGSVMFDGTANEIYLVFDMTANDGIATIEYEVRDEHLNLLIVEMEVRAINRIPRDPGIYDDSSFAFDYTQTWSAISEVTAINNTLHTTNTNGATAGFGFYGTGFTLYMKGQGGLAGGNFGLNIFINGAASSTPVTGWTNLPGSTTVHQATVSDANTVFFCTTDAIRLGNLSSTPSDYYAITCNAFSYTDTGNGVYDTSESISLAPSPSAIHLVQVVNLSTKRIAVDAFTLLDDNETPTTADVPLRPGFHDVDELAVRGAFGSAWVETRVPAYSNGIAYVLTGLHTLAGATNTVSFHVNGGTGFAIGTTQESMQTAYTVCVTNTTTNEMTCQRFDYIKPTTTPLIYGVFRPIYGLNPDPAITYRVDILPENVPAAVKFVLDSVVVFEPIDVPLTQLAGSVDNAQFESFVLGGGLEDSWTFASGVTSAFDGTLTTVATTARGAGPFIAFETDSTVDTLYWTTNGTRLSAAAMVCVDRNEGVDTNSNGDDVPTPADVDTAYGNCLVVNLTNGNYWRVPANGLIPTGTPHDGNIQLTKSTFIFRESDFRVAWDSFDSDSTLVFEIFSIYDTSIALDRVVAIGSGVALTAGRYEEYTTNIEYWQADGVTPATIGESESTNVASYATLGTNFVQVFGAGAARDFSQGVMYTKTSGLMISFQFTGTGFAPAFRMMPSSEEVEICWLAGNQTPNDTLTNGVCQIFDNQSRTTINNGLRPILGLPTGTYTAVIRFRGDNFAPSRNTSASPDMWFDGVVIYEEDHTTLTPLALGVLTQGNFSRHEDFNTFEYLGTGWASDTSSRARSFSSANVDMVSRGEVGATVIFQTSGANAIVLTRNLNSAYTPFLVCATEATVYTNRRCQTIDNTARGTSNEITIYLTNNTVAPFGNYLVTITALTNGPMFFDAVTALDTSGTLTEGQYDDNDPHIIYNYGSRNLILNGDFESTIITGYWTGTATRVTGTGQFYTGTAALNLTNAAMDSGATSHSFELRGGVTYTFSAHVRLTSGNVRLDGPGTCLDVADGLRLNTYQPLRCIYTPATDETVTLSILANGGSATFNVDDVRVTEGATWLTIEDRNAFGGFRQLSTTHGAEIRFGITGTGFGLGLTAETTGGRMMVCYKSYDPMTEELQEVSFDYENDDCISFENESSAVRADTLRIIDGLPNDDYAVMVRDMEDGDSVLRSPVAIRTNRLSVGQIRLDYILVFDTTAPSITLSGNYSESADDGGGNRLLQLLPADRWTIFSNATFSDGTYASPIDANAVASRTTAGTTLLLSVNGGTEARVVLDLKTGVATNSNQILACVDSPDGIVTFNHTTNRFEIDDDDGLQECAVITNATTSRFLTLTPTNLEVLATPGLHTITVQPLSIGTFTLDDYQVLFDTDLLEGYYEETMVLDIASVVSGTWTNENNPLYSGGSALVLSDGADVEPDGSDPGTADGSITFSFTGTGISVVHGINTIGGFIEVDITAGPVTIDNAPITTDGAALIFGNGQSFTGLPFGTYTVTITGYADAGEKVVLDAVEIYGTLQTLGSLYDDNEVDGNGEPYLTFGPDNASWTLKTGAAAPTALNRTLHSTNRAGATVSFEMSNATGIILYYGAGTATSVQVCFREAELADGHNAVCSNVTITTTAGNVQVNVPIGAHPMLQGTDFLVSITNTVTNRAFQVDAVQVLELGLHEGIFDATDIDADSTSTHNGVLNGTTNTIELSNGDSLSFDMTGIAFSLIVENAVNQDGRYTICVEADGSGTCADLNDTNDIVNEDFRFLHDTVPATGLSAISYAGLQNASGDEQTVTVFVTNNHTGAMRIKALHILGQDTGITITDTGRHENTGTDIRYLPFSSMVNTVITGNRQSGGSEHSGTQFGEMVYFEIQDLSGDATTGFEYVRQVGPSMTGRVEVCFGQIGDGVNVMTTQSSDDARDAGQCSDDNITNVNSAVAYQVSDIISTAGLCEFGCWVTIRNQQAKPMSFDYVRLFDAGAALTEGYYQDNYPGLNYTSNTGATWSVSRVANALASDGFVHQATAVPNVIDNENGAVFWFVMHGTGFSIDFVNDTFSDEVEICYAVGTFSTFPAVQTSVLDGGTCQIFDNESRVARGDAQRNVLGLPIDLPSDTYTVAVRMRRDNLSPARHSATASPVKMNIDGVEIYNVDWTSLENLTGGNYYDTDYLSRTADNRFFYVGESWTTLEGSRARSNTGGNLDQVREYGGAIAFRASGADAVTLYTNLGRSNTTFRICATPVDAGITAIGGATVCQDFSTIGTGNQQPLSFRFRDFFAVTSPAYLVSISSMNDLIGFIDAVELTTTTALSEGFYEGTNVNLFTDITYTDYVYNGRMEANAFWETISSPVSANQSAVRYEGAFGWHVVADGVGDGIESLPFSLEQDVVYTAIARVKVTSGSVRLRLVEGNSPASIEEFRTISPTGTTNNGDWITLRAEFVLNSDYSDLRLQVVANSSASTFDVDDVHLYRGGLWGGVYNRNYSAGSAWQSQTAGSTLYFSFVGTGFELGTEFGLKGGEMEVCYDTNSDFTDGNDSCFIYQNESNRAAFGVSRTVAGLPFNTYYVRLRDDEDGRSGFRTRVNSSRAAANSWGRITVDYLRIFGTVTAVETPASFFNEDATDLLGNPYLQLYPSAEWARVSARAGTGYSANTYQAVIDSRGRASRTEAGQSAVLYVDVPAEGATVVLYTGPASRSTSAQFLVCAGDETNGRINQSETKVGTRYTINFFLTSPSTPGDCVLLNGTLGTALAVGPNDLAALGVDSVGLVRVSFTSLTAGQFLVDGFQVIHGNTLTAGVYDSFLPDNLLNFNSANATSANRAATGCNPDFNWCTVKVTRSFGGTVLSTQDQNANLSFEIQGTGFSILTNIGAGARMRICYTQTPLAGTVTFPAESAPHDNNTQDLSLGGFWCEVVTTNTVASDWNNTNTDRRLPARAPQYGFSYYGLPFGNYSVQVLMLEGPFPATVTRALQIDAIVVFSDYDELNVMGEGFYDNTEATVSLEPFTQWNETIARLGPPRGPFNLTETTSTNAGAIMQMRVDGNSITMFQTLTARNSSDVRICMVVTMAVIHCTKASASTAAAVDNPPVSPAPYALAFELANFSQSGRTTYFAPITFYGLGPGDHTIIIENRDHTKTLSFDAILVQD